MLWNRKASLLAVVALAAFMITLHHPSDFERLWAKIPVPGDANR